MDLFPFDQNHLSPIQSSKTSHRHNTNNAFRSSSYNHPLIKQSISSFNEELLLNDISKELMRKCSNQIQCTNTNVQINGNQFQFYSQFKDKGSEREREDVIEKMTKVINQFSFSSLSLCFAIQLMDTIRDNIKIKLSIEDIAIGALIISIKFNENYNDICSVKSIKSAFDSKYYYSYDLLRELEVLYLKSIDFDLNMVSPIIALEHIILRGIVFSNDFLDESIIIKQIKAKIEDEAREILNKVMKKASLYSKYNTFIFAMSLISYTRYNINLAKWNEEFTSLYSLTLRDVIECFIFIETLLNKGNSCNNNNIVFFPDYQPTHIINSEGNNYPNAKQLRIKVNVSSSLNELRLLSPSHYQKTIDSYNWKSQRSTSASLEETPLTTKYPIRTNSSHQNFNLNPILKSSNTNSNKVSNKKQATLIYKPIKKFLSSNSDTKTYSSLSSSLPIKTQPATNIVTQAIQSHLNSTNRKIIDNKIIKPFKKNSVLILDQSIGKSVIDTNKNVNHYQYSHRSTNKSKLSSSNKTGINTTASALTSSAFKQMMTKRIAPKLDTFVKENNYTVNYKFSFNQSLKVKQPNCPLQNKISNVLKKKNKLKPYVTLSNLGVKLPHSKQ